MGFISRDSDGLTRSTVFRALGPRDTVPPPLAANTDLQIHPTYWEALDLQDVLVTNFGVDQSFGSFGLLTDLPNAWDSDRYRSELLSLESRIKTTPPGVGGATQFEECVGDVLKLCFFRQFSNIQRQVGTLDGTARRDWIVSNRAETGFWDMVRQRYNASQVVFECKNQTELLADDFRQMQSYLTPPMGQLGFICFRGDVEKRYYQHVRRLIQERKALVMLTDKDLLTFVRQALNGKVKDAHLRGLLDVVERLT